MDVVTSRSFKRRVVATSCANDLEKLGSWSPSSFPDLHNAVIGPAANHNDPSGVANLMIGPFADALVALGILYKAIHPEYVTICRTPVLSLIDS